ncbi:hypothetical protein PFLG_02983, partial [Plasmodium falciparum RAJ116]
GGKKKKKKKNLKIFNLPKGFFPIKFLNPFFKKKKKKKKKHLCIIYIKIPMNFLFSLLRQYIFIFFVLTCLIKTNKCKYNNKCLEKKKNLRNNNKYICKNIYFKN